MRKILTTLALLTTIAGPAHAAITYTGTPTNTPPAKNSEIAWATLTAVIQNHASAPMLSSQFIPRVTPDKMDTGTDDFGYWRLTTPATVGTYTATIASADGFGSATLKPMLTADAVRVQSQAGGDYFAVTAAGASDEHNQTTGPDLYVHLTRNVPVSGYKMPTGEAHVTVVVTGFGA